MLLIFDDSGWQGIYFEPLTLLFFAFCLCNHSVAHAMLHVSGSWHFLLLRSLKILSIVEWLSNAILIFLWWVSKLSLPQLADSLRFVSRIQHQSRFSSLFRYWWIYTSHWVLFLLWTWFMIFRNRHDTIRSVAMSLICKLRICCHLNGFPFLIHFFIVLK